MMRNFSGLSAYLLVSLAAVRGAIAVPIPCLTTGTYQDLINSNAGGGCTISAGAGASLIFSNFTFTPAGVGTPAASGMGYTLDDPGVGIGGVPIFGFEFSPGLAVTGTAATSNATQDIRITYLVVPVGTAIVSAHLLQSATATGAGIAQVSENLTFCIASDPNNTSGTCRVFPGFLVSTAGSSHVEETFGAWTSQVVSKDINVSSGAVGGTAAISGVRDAVDLTAVVPEPTTYGFVSVALLAFGYLARRRRTEGERSNDACPRIDSAPC
jgi:PEP-CTERM motif